MSAISARVCSQFDGRALGDKTSTAALLSTVDQEGWPHLSFLSAGEVLVDGDHLALTLWAKAQSVAALEQQRRGVLFAAADGVVHEVRFEVMAVERGDTVPTAIVLAKWAALREHKAPYARVEDLIRFSLDDPAAAVARWEGQVAAMRKALATPPGALPD